MKCFWKELYELVEGVLFLFIPLRRTNYKIENLIVLMWQLFLENISSAYVWKGSWKSQVLIVEMVVKQRWFPSKYTNMHGMKCQSSLFVVCQLSSASICFMLSQTISTTGPQHPVFGACPLPLKVCLFPPLDGHSLESGRLLMRKYFI